MTDRIERWRTVRAALESLRDAPAAHRDTTLAAWRRRNPTLAGELEGLLECDRRTEPLWATPLPVRLGIDAGKPDATRPRIDGCALGEPAARGGSSTVYRGRAADGAAVAAKILDRAAVRPGLERRWSLEHATLARLSHPWIVQPRGCGTTADGLPYLLTDWVDGQPIDRYCSAHRLSTAARVELIVDVCSAVHHAHQRLVVHRDLKPANILITAGGEPRLLDFGVAKLLARDHPNLATEELGAAPMTLAYASPEQVRGEPVTTASDVYSLGVVLFELVCGGPPYRTDPNAPHPVGAVLTHPPLDPRATAARCGAPPVSRDLALVLRRCLAKDAADRYPSAAHLADDLRRWLQHRPVRARRRSAARSLAAWAKRQPLLAALVVAAIGTAIGGGAVAWRDLLQVRTSERIAWRAHTSAVAATGVLADLLRRGVAAGEDGGDLLRRGDAALARLHDLPEAAGRLALALAALALDLGDAGRASRYTATAEAYVSTTRGFGQRDREECARLRAAIAARSSTSSAAPRTPAPRAADRPPR